MESTVFIGSSFGGYVANMLSAVYDMPCLVFNPALAYRTFDLELPKPFPTNITSLSYIVLGKKDIAIRFKDNLDFISELIKGPKKLLIENSMAHRIPVNIFEKHVEIFFRFLDKKKLKSQREINDLAALINYLLLQKDICPSHYL